MILKRFLSMILLSFVFLMQTNTVVIAAQSRHLAVKKNNTYKKKVIKKSPKKTKPQKPEFTIPLVPDETAKALEGKGYKKHKYTEQFIEDDVSDLKLNQNFSKTKFELSLELDEPPVCDVCANIKPQFNLTPVYENESAVIIKPLKKISTKCKRIKIRLGHKQEKFNIPFPLIGETVQFSVINDVKDDGKIILPSGTTVYATVGEVSPRGMGGVPAEMTIEKFYLKDSEGKIVELDGEINSSGYTLAVWIGLIELATTPFWVGLAAPVLRVLPGGQAVVTPRKKYVVYLRT